MKKKGVTQRWCYHTHEVQTVMWSRKTLVMKASGSVRTWEFSALWSRVCTEKHLKLWFHLWNSHSRQAQTLLTWQRFTPGGLLTEEALSAHNLKSAGHIWNAVLLCSFSTLVKNIQAIKKKRKKKKKIVCEIFFCCFSANLLCLVPVKCLLFWSCVHARLCSLRPMIITKTPLTCRQQGRERRSEPKGNLWNVTDATLSQIRVCNDEEEDVLCVQICRDTWCYGK